MLAASKICTQAGATPIINHHMTKYAQMARSQAREPMQLSDLTGAGFGPVARQWMLLNYLTPYDADTGCCELWLNIGGSAGHGGLYSVLIDEGPFARQLPLNGRQWSVTVRTGKQAIEAVAKTKEAAKQQQAHEKLHERRQAIRVFLQAREPDGALKGAIAEMAGGGVNQQNVGPTLMAMLQDLEAVRAKKPNDSNSAQRYRSLPCIPRVRGEEAKLERLRTGQPIEEVFPEFAGTDAGQAPVPD
jgi:hypothetical protein